MEPRLKPFAALAAAILTLALTTCSNPIDFVAEITDAVMAANDKYLEVIAVTPVKNEPAFSPEDPLLIEFDRDIDLATVTTASIVVTPAITWATSNFDTGTHTLTLVPDSIEGSIDYSVTITAGVRGTDGSSLRDPYTWNFTTTNAPSGGIKINVVNPTYPNGSPYTNHAANNTLTISANSVVTQMRITQIESEIILDTLPWGSVQATVSAYLLSGTDGTKTVYAQFRDNAIDDHQTSIKSAAIVLDATAPVIVLNNLPTDISASGWTSDTTITETGSGIASFAWSKYAGSATVNFSTTTLQNTTITGGGFDGTLRLRLIATDGAGNPGYYYSPPAPLINVDIAPPTAPAVAGPGASTTDTTPTFTWSTGGGGNGYFRSNLDGGSWSAESTGTSATTGVVNFGSHSYYVQERDAAGNWSASGSATTFVYPTYLVPAHAATGVDRSPTVQWGTSVGTARYTVYARRNIKFEAFAPLVSNTTAYYVIVPSTTPLSANTEYLWYFERTLFGFTTRYPSGTQYFRFTTGTANTNP